jgi:glycosyltransferase involved in cell wall biosynthesis
MSTKPKISIVIPVYQGENSIENLVDQLIDSLKERVDLEIMLVNDDSPDDSEAICIGLHHKYPQIVKFISLAKNVGEHNAVMAGLNYCTGEGAIIMDDDFQNPVSEAIKIMEYMLENNFDVVYTYYESKKHSLFRNLGSRFNDRVSTLLLKKPRKLYLSSFKILNRFLINEIIKYDLPYPYIDGLILRTTSKIGKLKVEHQQRRDGKSGYTLRKLIALWMNMFTNFSIVPLRISIYVGVMFSIFGFGLSIYTLIEKILNPELPQGYAMLLIAISVFSGIILIAIGMVGEYIGRIFLSFNKKPQFTIRERYT